MQAINHYSLDKQTENLYRVIQWIMSYPMDSITIIIIIINITIIHHLNNWSQDEEK